MQQKAITEILRQMPRAPGSFSGSEYVLPVKATFLGEAPLDLRTLQDDLVSRQSGDVKDLLQPLLLAAEQVEASMPDRDTYFIDDHRVQSYVFTGSKWRAGWVLVLGGTDQKNLIEELKARELMVFTDQPGVPDTYYIGARETSPIYFLQMMVRYGLTWGRIRPGDDHEMGHFLEKDMPGFMIILDDLPPLKYTIALGLMSLGAPAVVPSTFPFPYGNRIVADGLEEIVARGLRFPNLRLRYFRDEIIRLPDFCNVANVNEEFVPLHRFGGDADSFFCVRHTATADRSISVVGTPKDSVGILVEIAHEHLSDDLASVVERVALKAANYVSGVRANEEAGLLCIETLGDPGDLSRQIGESIYWGIRLQYPRLEKISVKIIFEALDLRVLAPEVQQYKQDRRQFIDSMSEDNTDEFCICTECRPFSLVHTCIVTPDRIPMCASRTYFTTKADAYFGMSRVPYQRQTESDIPLKTVFQKGAVIDAERGEYEGVNQVYREMTQGKLDRVFLHSVRGHPHTSCGCFQNLAFWVPEVQGIGIMSRGSDAVTPDGMTWDLLANRAGGKQSDGILGVSLAHILSASFLKADGGIGNVVWVDSKLYKRIAHRIQPGKRIATEKDVSDLVGLKRFLGR